MNRKSWVLCCAAAIVFVSTFAGGQEIDPFGEPTQIAPPVEQGLVEEKSVLTGPTPVAAEPTADFCQCVGKTNSPTVAKIETALASPLHSQGFDFAETPLEEVVNIIQSDYGFPVHIDRASLEEIGLSTDEPVTIQLGNISLRSALRHMLKPLQLTFIIRDEVLVITTPDEANKQLVVCVYDVSDIIGSAKDDSVDQLTNAIIACVATDTWAKNGGGEAEIRWLKPAYLVVSQTHAVHDEIRGLVATLRDVRKRPATKPQPQPLPSN